MENNSSKTEKEEVKISKGDGDISNLVMPHNIEKYKEFMSHKDKLLGFSGDSFFLLRGTRAYGDGVSQR